VEKIIEKGLPDGRKRFILYVLSAYLVNVKRLSEEEALQVVQEFLENSCRNHGNCEKYMTPLYVETYRGLNPRGLNQQPWRSLERKTPSSRWSTFVFHSLLLSI